MSLTAIIIGAVLFLVTASRIWVRRERERDAQEDQAPVAVTTRRSADRPTRAMALAAGTRKANPGTRAGLLDNLPSDQTAEPRWATALAEAITIVALSVAAVAVEVVWLFL